MTFSGSGPESFGEVVEVVAADGLEGGVEAVPVFEAHGSDEAVGVAALDVVLVDADELIAVGKRQGTQDDGVDGGEDRAVGADAEREGEDDGERERRRFAQEAQCGFEIEDECFGDGGDVDFADGLPDLFAATEFERARRRASSGDRPWSM